MRDQYSSDELLDKDLHDKDIIEYVLGGCSITRTVIIFMIHHVTKSKILLSKEHRNIFD